MKISVIVAAYNAEKYVTETLESIVHQTIDDYEIIVVNDGSTDGTLEILKGYEQDYHNLHVIDKENGGPSSARNAGLDIAQGDYVYFFDADDILELDALECLYEAAVSNKADLVIAKYDIFNEYQTVPVNDLNELVLLDKIDKYDIQILWTFSLCNKLCKRGLIEQYSLRLPPISYSEDGAFLMQMVYYSQKITGLNKVIFHYRRFGEGESEAITASISPSKIRDYITAHQMILKAAEKSIMIDFPQYASIKEAKREDVEIRKYLSAIVRKELRILVNQFYAKFWTLDDATIQLITSEVREKFMTLDMWDISLLEDAHPEISFFHLETEQSKLLKGAYFTAVLYGDKENKEDFLNSLRSLTVQNLIAMKILVPEAMRQDIEAEGMMQGNLQFAKVSDADELFYSAIDSADTPYMLFGDAKIAYANNAFKYAFKRFIKSSADFMIELIYHRNYGEPQAVVLNNIVMNSLKNGYENNSFLCMDNTLANKFFRTEFLKSQRFDRKQSLLSHLPQLYRLGYYTFMNDGIVFYEDTEESFLYYVGTSDTIPFIREYIKDKPATLNSPEIVTDLNEILPKLIRFPGETFMQKVFRKLVTYLRRKPLKNQTLFFSIRKNGELEGNAKALYPYIKGEKVICAKRLPHNPITELKMFKQIFTSKMIITDDYVRYLRYFPLREEQRVVQLWHACGAFKKFGCRGTNLSVFLDNSTHAQYNMAVVSGGSIRQIYADAFNIDMNKVKALGSPRTDDFFNPTLIEKTKEKIYDKYPEFKDRFIIIYAPTFRDIKNDRTVFQPELDFERLSKELLPDQMFLICPHPVMNNSIVDKKYENIKVIRDFSTNDLMFISDMLVTDYSSVIFEYALLKKPIAFFCYDLATYDRGFYLNYPEDLPGDVYENQDELTEYLRSPKQHVITEKYNTFVEKYMSACDGHSCERIAGMINSYMEEGN